MYQHHIITIALATLALAAPTAVAKPINTDGDIRTPSLAGTSSAPAQDLRNPDRRAPAPTPKQDLRSPDARDAAAGRRQPLPSSRSSSLGRSRASAGRLLAPRVAQLSCARM